MSNVEIRPYCLALGILPVDSSGIAIYSDTNAPGTNAFYRTVYP